MLEAKCQMCGETFIPHSEDPEDLIHGWSEEQGKVCGGQGVVQGEWRPLTDTEQIDYAAKGHTIPEVRKLHTLESHEREMPNCDDPDCEFHHPEVREF